MKYKLLKDLPWCKAGTVFVSGIIGNYYYPEGNENEDKMGLYAGFISNPDWFEPIPEWEPKFKVERTGHAVSTGDWAIGDKVYTAESVRALPELYEVYKAAAFMVKQWDDMGFKPDKEFLRNGLFEAVKALEKKALRGVKNE